MVGRLPRGRRTLCRIGDDRIGRLIDLHLDRAERIEIAGHLGLRREQVDERLQRPGRLVLVEAELEMHRVDREGVAPHAEFQIERTLTVRAGLVEPVDRERVAKHVLRADEPRQRPPGTHHGRLRSERRRRPLRIGELVAGANRPKWHIVGHSHADRRLDLVFRAAEGGGVGGRACDGAMVDVVDSILPQRKDLGEPAANLVDQEHHAERRVTGEAGLPRRRDRDGVIVVVAKLAGRPPLRLVVAEVRAVGVPLTDGRRIGRHCLFNGTGLG